MVAGAAAFQEVQQTPVGRAAFAAVSFLSVLLRLQWLLLQQWLLLWEPEDIKPIPYTHQQVRKDAPYISRAG